MEVQVTVTESKPQIMAYCFKCKSMVEMVEQTGKKQLKNGCVQLSGTDKEGHKISKLGKRE